MSRRPTAKTEGPTESPRPILRLRFVIADAAESTVCVFINCSAPRHRRRSAATDIDTSDRVRNKKNVSYFFSFASRVASSSHRFYRCVSPEHGITVVSVRLSTNSFFFFTIPISAHKQPTYTSLCVFGEKNSISKTQNF